MRLESKIILFLTLFISFCHSALGIAFHLAPNLKKCLREEVQKDDVVKGEFELSVTAPEIKTDFQVSFFYMLFLTAFYLSFLFSVNHGGCVCFLDFGFQGT